MRKTLAILTLLTIGGMFAGCPRPSGTFKYTSADLQGGYRNLAVNLDAAGGGGEGGGTTPREVVEPDVIRQVDQTLFVLNQYRGLTLVDLDSQTILDQVPTLGFPRDLYVAGNRAYVLVAYAADFQRDGDTVDYSIASRLYVVDISDPADCSIVSSFDLDGDLTDSRLVGEVLYAVTAEYDWSWVGAVPLKSKTSASHIVSVNIADESHIFKADQVSTDSIGDVVYATPSAIFVSGWDWDANSSKITLIDISDPAGGLQVGDSVVVDGYVSDRFKMDVYNGVLRVVSNGWQNARRTYIATVDITDPNNLQTLAGIEFERAHGDTLFATRFDGPRAYVVTYFQVDPLFVLDLSDPQNPVVSGELEVPGWSTYIEPRGDRLIALGVDNSDGGWQVSLSLFNVSDPANPSLSDRVRFGQNWSWSSAYQDVKALTVLDDIVIVPFSGWEEGGGGFDRLQFVSWTQDDLTARGAVDLQGGILRSFEHAGSYYGVTSEQLAQIDASDLDHPAVVKTTALAENVADFVELSSEVGVEIITRSDSGETVARAVGLPLKSTLGEASAKVGNLVATYKHDDDVVLVGTSWDDNAGYKIATVDFSDPAHPEVSGELSVDVWPYYGYWWFLPYYDIGIGGGVVPMATKSVAVDSIAYWPWFPSYRQKSTLLAGDILVLRCTADSFDETIGDGAAHEGLALVDLNSLSLTKTVGLGFDAVSNVDTVGDKLYISSKTYIGRAVYPLSGPPECAYFITEFDPATGDAGPAVNVPGMYVQYDPDANVLTLRDDQWDDGYDSHSVLRTVSWSGGIGVSEIDNTALPRGTSTVLGRGPKVYIQAYDSGIRLHTVNVSGSGALQTGGDALVTNSWANLVDANGTSVYFGVGGGAIVRYDCSNAPALKELVEVMGTPESIRFGENTAYAPLGYFGIVQLPL